MVIKRTGKLVEFAPAAVEPKKPAEEAPQAKPIKRQKVFVLTPEQEDQLADYCHDMKTTIQAVVIEGINSVLRSKGLPELKS